MLHSSTSPHHKLKEQIGHVVWDGWTPKHVICFNTAFSNPLNNEWIIKNTPPGNFISFFILFIVCFSGTIARSTVHWAQAQEGARPGIWWPAGWIYEGCDRQVCSVSIRHLPTSSLQSAAVTFRHAALLSHLEPTIYACSMWCRQTHFVGFSCLENNLPVNDWTFMSGIWGPMLFKTVRNNRLCSWWPDLIEKWSESH